MKIRNSPRHDGAEIKKLKIREALFLFVVCRGDSHESPVWGNSYQCTVHMMRPYKIVSIFSHLRLKV